MKIIEKFHDTVNNDESLVKHPSQREFNTENLWLQNIVNEIEGLDPEPIKMPNNVTQAEIIALQSLKDNHEIIIKKANKTSIMVLMDLDYYREKLVLQDHLSQATYEVTNDDADKKTYRKQQVLLHKHKNCITKKEYDFITNYEWKSSNFYVNPKIAKSKEISDNMQTNNSGYLKMAPPISLKGRPIIAGPKSPTKNLSKLLEKILSPLVLHQKSYVKDDWAFLRHLPAEIEYEAELFTCDIVSLYTSIPHDLGVSAMKYWVQKRRNDIPIRFSEEFILEAIAFVSNNNNFYFDGKLYHQLQGTGMGVDFAAPYACLTIGFLEETKLF